ncbi:fibronectin type III domain-containing protein, partial [Winogradskyella sp. SYSU M77433]|uniref:fibronectin type III domain-containing protein n=1 Tax=Winogradskyella sp. SYSU M77433 TaxID=3042722 RepID=UPI00247FDF25
TTPALSFYEISDNEGNANSQLDVEVWDGAAWNNMGTYNTNTSGWELKIIDLSGLTITGDVQARFIFSEIVTGDFYDDIAIDDVTFDEAPTCFSPTQLTATNLSLTSTEVSWTDAVAGSWNIEYGPSGFTQGTGTVVTGVTNPYTINGLTADTYYEFYVQAVCGAGDVSAFAGPLEFFTGYCVSEPTSNDGNGVN